MKLSDLNNGIVDSKIDVVKKNDNRAALYILICSWIVFNAICVIVLDSLSILTNEFFSIVSNIMIFISLIIGNLIAWSDIDKHYFNPQISVALLNHDQYTDIGYLASLSAGLITIDQNGVTTEMAFPIEKSKSIKFYDNTLILVGSGFNEKNALLFATESSDILFREFLKKNIYN